MAGTEESLIAEVYAQSLLELATEQGKTAEIDQEFAEFGAYLKIDPDFKTFITSRMIDEESRCQALDRIFQGGMSDLLLNTLQVINEKGRAELIGEVQRQYHLLYMKQEGVIDVQVTTATSMNDMLKNRVQLMMASHTGKKINLIEQVDAGVLGGLVLRVGDEQIDMSVAHQLERFHQTLVEHARQHIHTGTDFFEDAKKY